MINRALQERAAKAENWSVCLMGGAGDVSKTTVQRWFSLFGIKPHLAQTFKLSIDPFFIEKVRDILGLYLPPPPTTRWCCASMRNRRSRL